MKRFEYKEDSLIADTLIPILNRWGEEGWQVISLKDNGLTINGWKALNVIFMREVSDE